MSISYVHHQLSCGSLIRSRGVQGTFKTVGPRATPGSSLPLLAPGLTEGGGADHWVPRVGPAIGMGGMGVVDVKIIHQTGFKVLRRAAVPPLQKTTCHDAQPQLDLMEPRPMFRRQMEHRCMC